MNNPQSLVSRVFKARYFPNSHILNAKRSQNSSFIWQGLVTAMEALHGGFRWVLGDGEEILATKDQWIRSKQNVCVENSHGYIGRSEMVATYILHDPK